MSVINDDEAQRRWHIKHEISTGDIILACTMVVAVGLPLLAWAVGLTNRVSVLEERVAAEVIQEDRDTHIQNQQLHDSVSRIENSLHDIQTYLLTHSAVQGH